MEKANISLQLRKDRKDKNGLRAIRIRSIIKRKVSYYNTKVVVHPDNWDGKEIINVPNKQETSALLRKKLADFEKTYLQAAITETEFKPGTNRKADFHAFWEKRDNSKFKSSYLGKLKDFKDPLYFTDLTPAFLSTYEKHCEGLGNGSNTIWNALKFVKSTINAAIKEGVIKVNPSIGYGWPRYTNPKREYLTEGELDEIYKLVMGDVPKPIRDTGILFLFSAYSSLRFGDVFLFRKAKHIKEGRIILRTEKTGNDVSIKIYPKLKEIIDLLPETRYTNKHINDLLKHISEALKFSPLHFHLARHTFGVMFLNKGGSFDSLMKIMGHTDMRTTLLYGRITNLRLDDEIDKVFG